MFRCRSSSKTFCETFWYDDPGRAPSSSRRFTKCHKTFEDFLVSIIDPTILPIRRRTACHLLCDITTSDTVRTRMQLHSRSAALVCPNLRLRGLQGVSHECFLTESRSLEMPRQHDLKVHLGLEVIEVLQRVLDKSLPMVTGGHQDVYAVTSAWQNEFNLLNWTEKASCINETNTLAVEWLLIAFKSLNDGNMLPTIEAVGLVSNIWPISTLHAYPPLWEIIWIAFWTSVIGSIRLPQAKSNHQ